MAVHWPGKVAPGETNTANTLILNSPASRTVKKYKSVIQATPSVVHCYGSPRHQIQSVPTIWRPLVRHKSSRLWLYPQICLYFPPSHSMSLEKCVNVCENPCLAGLKYDFMRFILWWYLEEGWGGDEQESLWVWLLHCYRNKWRTFAVFGCCYIINGISSHLQMFRVW